MPFDVLSMVRERSVIVCCGAGGVGKTTAAAALGMLGASVGRRVCVMTIDPARRLAQAMGLEVLGDEPQAVAVAQGSLDALMLNPRHTIDHMVETYAPSARVRNTIFANRYYQELSATLGGSRELLSMERVLEIASNGDYDLLIVDTPPAQHALDFLDAPRRLIDMLDGTFTQMLLAPYSVAARAQFNLFRQSSAAALKFLERLTGVGMLADLSEFLLAFSSMFDGLKERSQRVMALMSEPSTTFVLVCAPEPVSLSQVQRFSARLAAEAMDVSGVLVNRVRQPFGEGELEAADIRALDGLSDALVDGRRLSERVDAALQDARALAAADQQALELLDDVAQPRRYVPHMNRDLHSLADLEAFAGSLS